MSDLTPTELEEWLEWAGVRLIAMPGRRVGPSDYRSFWPDFSNDVFQVLEFRRYLPVKSLAPSKDEIPIMEEVLQLPCLCPDVKGRRILHMRCLIHPITRRHLFTWKRASEKLQSDPRTLQRLHEKSLETVAKVAPPFLVLRLKEKLDLFLERL